MKSLAKFAIAATAALAFPASAAAADPALTVPQATLDAAIHCHGPALQGTNVTPIMLVTGTGASGEDAYAFGKGAFDLYGHPVCDVNFPYNTTANIQTSVQYLVNGIRYEYAQSGRKIAVFGISQGGLLPRVALTYWPSLRSKVDDVIAAAGTQHGTNVFTAAACITRGGCPPAVWQQGAGSNFQKQLAKYPDETPGSTSWTTVRSLTDETVQPQSGAHPTSSLKGATNILIQSVCSGRKTAHIQTAVDSVTFAAIKDAIEHPGPAKVSRFPSNTCSHPFADGLDPATTWITLAVAKQLTAGNGTSMPTVPSDPVWAPDWNVS
jgi:hypothetical protein